MNRRELMLGTVALAVSAALPAVAATPPVTFHVLTSRGLYIGTYPSRFPLDAEVQQALDGGSVTWGACSIPKTCEGLSFTGDINEERQDVGNGWTRITRTNGRLTTSVYAKGGRQYGAQLERSFTARRRLIEPARTNYALHSVRSSH